MAVEEATKITSATSDEVELYELSQQQTADDVNSDNISQLELMQKLMGLIISLQDMQNIINGSTLNSELLNADMSHLVAEASQIILDHSVEVMDEYNKQLKAQDHQSLLKKIFGTILSSLTICLGAVLCAFGGPAGIMMGSMMIAMSALSITSTYCPEAVDKFMDFISGGNPAIAAAIKLATIAAVTAVAIGISVVTMSPAIGIMTFTTMFTMLNPTEDIAESIYMHQDGLSADEAKKKAENNQTLQYVIMGTNLTLTVIGAAASFAMPKTPGALAKQGEKAASQGERSACAASGIAGEAGAASSKAATTASNIAQTNNRLTENLRSGLQTLKKIMASSKDSMQSLQAMYMAVFQVITAMFSLSQAAVSIYSASTEIKIGKIKEEYQTLSATTTMLNSEQDLISSDIDQTNNFMKNMQDSYQACLEDLINNIFSYVTTFANVYSKDVA